MAAVAQEASESSNEARIIGHVARALPHGYAMRFALVDCLLYRLHWESSNQSSSNQSQDHKASSSEFLASTALMEEVSDDSFIYNEGVQVIYFANIRYRKRSWSTEHIYIAKIFYSFLPLGRDTFFRLYRDSYRVKWFIIYH